ncbi:MAG TPA: hypothetical protein VEX35_10020 [Allosphingosinicella sp.]|nr:hypothetical protein [Allosphingosinicella sp.]
MNRLHKSIWAGAALLALPVPAFAQDLCAGLRRIEAAAREPVSFASLEGLREEILPGFRLGCRVSQAYRDQPRAFICSRTQFAPASLIASTFGPAVRDCLGAEATPPVPYRSTLGYRTADVEIELSSHCDDRCHVGRSATLIARRREPR